MKTRLFAFALLLLAGMNTGANAQTIKPEKLTCEYAGNPLGIDLPNPQLSWTLVSDQRNQRQTAYELLVSDNIGDINHLKGNVWTTGKIRTAQSLHIIYSGAPLRSFTRYYWRVKVYDRDGIAASWSLPAWFETAMLSDADWQAKWIGDGRQPLKNDADFYKDDPAPLFRKTFDTRKKIRSARLYISGLGYYEASLNGRKIGEDVLSPGWTSYEKEVLYRVYDITGNIRPGANVAGIMLGNGWYNPLPLKMWGSRNLRNGRLCTGLPCVKAQWRLVYADGSAETIATDETWETMSGPILRNNVYLGEQYDARLEQLQWDEPGSNLTGMKKAVIVTGPSGSLSVQMQPPIKVTTIIKPVRITAPRPGVYLFDMGQNFAGVARIHVQAPAGTRIVLRYGEDIYKDGSLNVMTSVAGQVKSGNGGPGAPPVAWQEDSYITKGKGSETWSPRFTFHGFRYVEVTGWPGKPDLNDLEGLRMNADVEQAGTFSCSNGMFNKLNRNIQWTFLSNLFSVQSDCPAREKFGYGGDMFCTMEAFNFNFDMANFYRKSVQDLVDAQRPLGGTTETAPYVGIADSSPGDGSGPLGFQVGFGYAIKQLYDFYGDRRIIEENYAALKKQAGFLRDSAKSDLYYTDLSDHESLDAKPVAFTASAFYYQMIRQVAEFAGILGKTADAEEYTNLADRIRTVILGKFFDPVSGKFANGSQTAQVFGLWYPFVAGKEQKAAFDALLQDIDRRQGHLSTGIFGTKMMFDVLRKEDRSDIAYRIADQRDFPGWGYMIANSATTLWETWAYSDNVYSQNHPMFGSVDEWFYRSVLGINAGAPGFEKIIIKPQPAGDLVSAKGSYRSIRGIIVSDWRSSGKRFHLQVQVPANTKAEIWVPTGQQSNPGQPDNITESGIPVRKAPAVKFLRAENGYAVFATGSGKFSFEADCCSAQPPVPTTSIIPMPKSLAEKKGVCTISDGTTVYFNNPVLRSLADYTVFSIKNTSGLQLQIAKAMEQRKGPAHAQRNEQATTSIRLQIDSSIKTAAGGYQLTVDPGQVTIRSATAQGLFYGVQTLVQLIPVNGDRRISCVAIGDEPRFAWRGILLDVSRHFFTIAEVKRLIDEMAVYKFNLLHLHLTDDQGWRLEIKSLPELTKKGAWRVPRTGRWGTMEPPKEGEEATDGGFYTQEEIKELIRYASARFIQILPEIDVPGHSLAAISSYPDLSCTKLPYPVNPGSSFYTVQDNALCPGQEATFEFLDKVFTEVAALFPFDYIHIGGDECFKGFWKNCRACQQRMKDNGLKDGEELQSYFVRRLEKILRARGKKLLGWDEILEGGLAPDATVMSWRGIDGGIAAAKAGHLVVMTPANHAYLDLYQGDPAIEPPTYGMLRLKDVYSFDPVPDGVDPKYILGGQGNLWTESIPTFRHAEYMLWPRAMALSEAVWSPNEKKDWNGFIQRMEHQIKRLDRADINYSRSCYDAIIQPSVDTGGNVQIRLNTEIEGLDLYYTFDNTYPDQYSTLYKKGQFLSIPAGTGIFKVISYREGKPVGRIVSVSLEDLTKRIPGYKSAARVAVSPEIFYEIPLYDGAIPNAISGPDEEERTFDPAVDSLVNKVSRPALSAYLPAGDHPACAAVIICPGGGYHTLLITREGRKVAKAFNKAGVAAFVLKYRLPSDKTMRNKSIGPLQDAQRAIQIVRENAVKWHIDPHKIGIMGFSAGGHLAATAGTHFEKAWIENTKGTSLRPDFMILVYPVISLTDSIGHIGSRNYLLGNHSDPRQVAFFSNEFHVNDSTPPAFITHASDDIVVPVANSLQFYDALVRKHIPAELHIYASGGHGYLKKPSFEEWFGRCLNWMKVN